MRQLARVLVLVAGGGLAALGLLGGAAGLATSQSIGDGSGLLQGTAVLSALVLSVGLGSGLAWHALRSILDKPSREFLPRQVWPLFLAFVSVVAAGQLVLSRSTGPSVLFPPLHVLACTLPPLAIVVMVSRRLNTGARWRDVTLQIGSGAFLSTGLAFTLELVLLLAIAVALLVPQGLGAGAPEGVQAWAEKLQDATWLEDPGTLGRLARSPEVVGLALLVVAGLVPLIEEGVKTIGVGLLAYRRPVRSLAFLWGVCSGAGFALAEGLLNSLAGIQVWAPLILLRVGATLLHSLAGGLTGLAWYGAVTERSWSRPLGLYACAVAIHALWNALTVAYVVVSLRSSAPGPAGDALADSSLAAFGILGLLVALAVAIGVTLARLTRRLQRPGAQPADPGT